MAASPLSLVSELSLFGLLILSPALLFGLPSAAGASSKGFTVELIHRDSPKSPLYNHSQTHSNRLRAAARRSRARAELLHRTLARSEGRSLESELKRSTAEYLMAINVGTPPKRILTIADTGSDLIWSNCEPCTSCFPSDAPHFDPSASSTFRALSCDSDPCAALPGTACGDNDSCTYVASYGDGSQTSGTLATETFTFRAAADGGSIVRIPSISFGCSDDSEGLFDGHSGGIVGLGGGPLSLVSQLGSSIDGRFSYCLVSAGANHSSSQLRFGADAVVSGKNAVSTQLVPALSSTFYVVTLDGISVDGVDLPIEQGNIIVDSGTTLTLLAPAALKSLSRQLESSISLPRVDDPQGTFTLCFDVRKAPRHFEFPDVTFHFGTAPVKLPAGNAFLQLDEGTVCLAMIPVTGSITFAIFGNIAQQNFHIGYDLVERTITFAPTDCSLL
ncbi:Aspartic proteinase CDR1 [Ananas comosus]|uniref:nepenthesin n=1 Tax=Ananas comosus TaxID=4615 RepID=A0A199UYD5_ANACO|nr:Aspartic proteinase CDR1 [Ananas comosus]